MDFFLFQSPTGAEGVLWRPVAFFFWLESFSGGDPISFHHFTRRLSAEAVPVVSLRRVGDFFFSS